MSALKERLARELEEMSDRDVAHLLALSKHAGSGGNTPLSGQEFVREFAGLIPADEMEAMERAIEEDCEAVDADVS